LYCIRFQLFITFLRCIQNTTDWLTCAFTGHLVDGVMASSNAIAYEEKAERSPRATSNLGITFVVSSQEAKE
jgi:hypothetical protein